MAANKMILKCAKTGRLFFSTQEAEEHAEAFGKEYANFDEVAFDTKVWVCTETGRPAYSEVDMKRIQTRDPASKTWEEKTVAYLLELQKKREQAASKKDRFLDTVNQKNLTKLTEIKQYTKNRAGKALHFTREAGTLEAAEAWLAEHEDDPGADKITDEFLDEFFASGDVPMPDANADVVMAEPEVDDRKVGDPNPPEIKEAVNQEIVKQVMEMGFSEVRAEKACFKTDNVSLEHAINWLTDHENDADIDLPLCKPPPPPPAKPKMSKEEAEQKAFELQKRLREKKAQEEKLTEKEKERMRVESTKMMVEAQHKLKEEEEKRNLEQIQREKEAHEKHRLELKEQLRLDYIERFGKEPPPEEEEKEKAVKEKSSKDQVAYWLQKLKKTYKDSNPQGLKTCLETLKVYSKNLMDNPQEVKFKKLKLDNKAFQARIAPFEGAIEYLDVIGFEKKEDCLEQRKSIPDGWLLGNALKFIDLMIGQL